MVRRRLMSPWFMADVDHTPIAGLTADAGPVVNGAAIGVAAYGPARSASISALTAGGAGRIIEINFQKIASAGPREPADLLCGHAA